MVEDNIKKIGLEQTVVDLLQAHSQNGVNQTNMLLMLSLVNLMGIVDVLQRSSGDTRANIDLQRGEMSQENAAKNDMNGKNGNQDLMNLLQQAATGQLDPLQLIGMLNQPGAQLPDPGALMGMLSQMMPPPQDIKQQQHPYHQPARENIQPREAAQQKYTQEYDFEENNMDKENLEKEKVATNTSAKTYLKWDPRLG